MPTRAGWGVLAGGLVLLAAGRLVGGVEFLVPGAVAVLAVVGAVLVRRLLPSRIAIAKQLTPPRVPAGDPARVDLEIVNRNPRRSPLLRLHDAVTGTSGVNLSVAPLGPDGGSSRGAERGRRSLVRLPETQGSRAPESPSVQCWHDS